MKRRITSFRMIIWGFVLLILLGTFLLTLPISSNSGSFTSFSDALFTATSASCVTGLVLKDTASYWSLFGQMVILLLIQIGGMGVITITAFFAVLSGKKISLLQRSAIVESISAPDIECSVRFVSFVIKGTLFIEMMAAFIMAPVFIRDFGLRGIWMAVFHSVSAFCNAGFDLMGTAEHPFSSLCDYSGNMLINFTIMMLIILGGIGFVTWKDISNKKLNFRNYSMQSKLILIMTAICILFPALYFFFFEFQEIPMKERAMVALFQAVTPRTAGFNTANLNQLSDSGLMVIIVLMLIGGAPGSTAGGMKVTTLAVLILNSFSVFKRRADAQVYGRRIESQSVKTASTVFTMYLCFFSIAAFLISIIEGLPLSTSLFETASAIGTVGLSLGITGQLSLLSQGILILLMFSGRVGGLTLIFAAGTGRYKENARLPIGKVAVG